MRTAKIAVAISVVLLSCPVSSWAATSSANASVSATLVSRTTVALTRDANSVTRFDASRIVFDRYDDQDPGVTQPNAGFMYAPYRSETGKNWHLASIFTNGTSMTLSASVSGTVGGQPLSNVLDLFCGGFFPSGSLTELSGTKSSDWEVAQGFTRTLSQAFSGVVPFNYRLRVSGISAGSFSGSVVLTLTSN